MWSVILIVVVLIAGLLIFMNTKSDAWDDFYLAAAMWMLLPVMITFAGITWTGINVANGRTIDEKIEMYSNENKAIEKQIDQVVKSYMAYESDTFKNATVKDSMAMVSLYPELKSDNLVKEQIKVYSENKKTITKLKENKINLKVSKWWLYFGG